MTVKCPDCKIRSTVKFSDPGMPINYCPACGSDVTCERDEDEFIDEEDAD